VSWDVILPFLRPIEPLLLDPHISDILINGAEHVFIEKDGQLAAVLDVRLTERFLQIAVRNIARVLGDDVSPEKPLLDARLPDGSRVAAVLAPCSVTGTTLAIRKFRGERLTAGALAERGMLTAELLTRLRHAVENSHSILISGGTGTGKTTLLTALAGFIPPDQRIVLIEDTSEIRIDAPNLVRLEARREQTGVPAVSLRDLLRTTLRLRPDRILLGEVRGGEAFELLQLVNTGHGGTLSTLHASSAAQAIARFTSCVLMSGIELPYRAIRSQIAEGLNLLVHIERGRHGERRVAQVLTVKGYDGALDRYHLETLYERG
jgi:pilus assembly protein CpaF